MNRVMTEGQELVCDGLDRIADVQSFLALSRSAVYERMDRGVLPSVKIGRSRRIPHRAVLAFAARHLVGGGQG
jgi:excisionase family DNA binding protein